MSSCAPQPAGPSPEELRRQQLAAIEAQERARQAEEEKRRRPAPVAASEAEERCLALAVYWEGKSEMREGRVAVAHVVLNRVRDPEFPNTICGVVQDRNGNRNGSCQFSWYCDGKSDEPTNAEQWREAQAVARAALAGETRDPTGGARYFHVRRLSPPWTRNLTRTAAIGDHVFYR